MSQCSLCHGTTSAYCSDKKRDYLCCDKCGLVQVPANFWLSATQEQSEYDLHENSIYDAGYRRFITRMLEPMFERLPRGGRDSLIGLDFGSGPEPILQSLFKERGIKQNVFDIFYANNPQVLETSYDFITATEVVEHLQQPKLELDRLWGQLKVGGLLGLMTKRVTQLDAFLKWHYKNDPTHICFFHEQTFRYLAGHWGADLEIISSDVVILRKIKPMQAELP
jgi:hypothetical protein